MAATKNKNEPNEFDNDIKSQNRNAGEHRRHFIYRTTKKILKKMKKRTKRRPMKSKKKSKRSNCRTLYKVNDDNDDDDEMCTVIF